MQKHVALKLLSKHGIRTSLSQLKFLFSSFLKPITPLHLTSICNCLVFLIQWGLQGLHTDEEHESSSLSKLEYAER